MVSREDLVLAKLLWSRDTRSEVQMRDVRNLAATDLDVAYMERWIPRLGWAGMWPPAAE